MRLVRHRFLYVWYLVLLFVFSSFFHGGNRLLSYCVLYHYEGMNGVQICYHHANVGDVIDSFEDRSRIGYRDSIFFATEWGNTSCLLSSILKFLV